MLCEDPEIIKIYQEIIDDSLADLAIFEKIEKFKLIPDTLRAPDDLTGAQKVKRIVVSDKFQAEVTALSNWTAPRHHPWRGTCMVGRKHQPSIRTSTSIW